MTNEERFWQSERLRVVWVGTIPAWLSRRGSIGDALPLQCTRQTGTGVNSAAPPAEGVALVLISRLVSAELGTLPVTPVAAI
jgi:hypothetical protein